MRPLSSSLHVVRAAAIAALITACNDVSRIAEPTVAAPAAASHTLANAIDVVHVSSVEQLYAAVNNAANAGATVQLAAGIYVLSAKNPSGANRPNAGRLELQQGMSIVGVADDRAAAVIDAASLPSSSFPTSFGRTGVIRIGRGSNAVEWLTIAGNPLAAAGVETDLGNTTEAWVRVAHVVAGNSARGVDVRNVGVVNGGRRLHAEIEDNDFFRGVEGVRVAAFVDANHGDISVVMSGNRVYENIVGCIFENNRSNFSAIYVRSSGDRFEDNGLGCQIGGGLVSSGAANSNSTILEAHGSQFINNSRTVFFNTTGPAFTEFGGFLVVGGDVLASAGTASSNIAVVRLWGCKVAGNQNIDFQAFGARSSDPLKIAGIDNHTTIELYGVSKKIDVVTTDSWPADASGSNTVTIVR